MMFHNKSMIAFLLLSLHSATSHEENPSDKRELFDWEAEAAYWQNVGAQHSAHNWQADVAQAQQTAAYWQNVGAQHSAYNWQQHVWGGRKLFDWEADAAHWQNVGAQHSDYNWQADVAQAQQTAAYWQNVGAQHSTVNWQQYVWGGRKLSTTYDWQKDRDNALQEASRWIHNAEAYMQYDAPCYESPFCPNGEIHQCTSNLPHTPSRSVDLCCPGKSRRVVMGAMLDCPSLKANTDTLDVEGLDLGGETHVDANHVNIEIFGSEEQDLGSRKLIETELKSRIEELEDMFNDMEIAIEDAISQAVEELQDELDFVDDYLKQNGVDQAVEHMEEFLNNVEAYIKNEMPCYESPVCMLGGTSHSCKAMVGPSTRSANICCPSKNTEIILAGMYDCTNAFESDRKLREDMFDNNASSEGTGRNLFGDVARILNDDEIDSSEDNDAEEIELESASEDIIGRKLLLDEIGHYLHHLFIRKTGKGEWVEIDSSENKDAEEIELESASEDAGINRIGRKLRGSTRRN